MAVDPLLIAVTVTVIVITVAFAIGRRPVDSVAVTEHPQPEYGDGGGGHPSVSIRQPKERSIHCQICLGRIKVGQGYAVCSCGREFHRTCVERTGYCPYCDLEYSRRGFRRRYNIPDESQVTLRRCPVCGDFIPREATICDCGAVFLGDDGSFSCPTCRSTVHGDDFQCEECGERFKEYNAVHCHHCGLLVPEGESVCECGTLTGDRCPDCGWKLGRDDERCPICGLVFEIVRD